MLPIAYGNFLRNNEQGRGRYEMLKPKLNAYASFFFAFGLCGMLTVGMFYSIEKFLNITDTQQIETKFQQYQALNTKIKKTVSEEKQLKNTNVIDDIATLVGLGTNYPEVVLTAIDIRQGKFTVSGQVTSLKKGDALAAELASKGNKQISFSKVVEKPDYIEFTMNINSKNTVQKPLLDNKQNVKGGAR